MAKKSKLAKIGAGIAAAYLASKMGDSSAATDTAAKNFDYEYDAYKGASKKSSTTPFEHEGSVIPSKKTATATASVRKKMQPGPKSINVSGVRNFGFGSMGFKSGGAVVTKGQGKSMRPKKTILLT